MGNLAVDTAVEGGNGRFRARLSPDWEIWGPNGGYVAAIALRAAGAATALRRPASLAGHFLNVARFAPVDLEVTTLRAARRAESLRVSMTQDGRPIFEALVWVVADGDGLTHDTSACPEVPAPQTLRPLDELLTAAELGDRFPFWRNFEVRPIDWMPWPTRTAGAPVWREWLRFRPDPGDDPFVDAARSLVLIDTMIWPAACQPHLPEPRFIAPSLDVAVQFHQLDPTSAWLLADAAAPLAAHGLMSGQARVWSERGALLASGTGHLLCRPAPPPPGA